MALNYSLLCTACPPLVSRLLDLGNVRFTVIYFFVLFIVSCTVTGSAKSMTIVAVGRALTGVANTGIYQLCVDIANLVKECSRVGFVNIAQELESRCSSL